MSVGCPQRFVQDRSRLVIKHSSEIPFPLRGIRNLTILGRQRDDDGQNKLLQINGIVKIIRGILSIV